MRKTEKNKRILVLILTAIFAIILPIVSNAEELSSTSDPAIEVTTENTATDTTSLSGADTTLTLSVLTDDNLFRVVGESGASTVNIIIKDKSYAVVKEATATVSNGRFDWHESLSNYTTGQKYNVYVTDSNGTSGNEAVTVPAADDSYTLNLGTIAGKSYLTIAGESSCATVKISVKSSTYVQMVSTTAAVIGGRFEYNDPIARYTEGSSYYVTVTDTTGHTSSETVTIPKEDIKDEYTLTLMITAKDGNLKIAGESSENRISVIVKNDSFTKVTQKGIDIKSGRYSWNQSVSNFEENMTYTVTVTDNKDHTTTDTVTIPVTVKNIEFGDFEKKVEAGKTLSITATVLPSTASNQTVTYTSSDENIATISASGRLTGKSPGKVTIKASAGSADVSVEITVYNKTSGINLNENYLTLRPNETFQIEADIYPKTAVQKCRFTSTNTKVVGVSETGLVKAVKEGIASIIVSNGDAESIMSVVVTDLEGNSVSYWGRSVNSYSVAEHLESSQLAQKIHGNNAKTLVLNSTDLKNIDPSALLMLKNEDKNLVIDNERYVMMIKGNEIINPANAVLLDISVEQMKDKIKFVLNNEEPLPGKITIQLRSRGIDSVKYLYLYNPVKNKYEKIDSFNVDDKSLHLDEGGAYLLTEKKLHNGYLNWKIGAAVGSVCLMLGIVYILMKRKYWFY